MNELFTQRTKLSVNRVTYRGAMVELPNGKIIAAFLLPCKCDDPYCKGMMNYFFVHTHQLVNCGWPDLKLSVTGAGKSFTSSNRKKFEEYLTKVDEYENSDKKPASCPELVTAFNQSDDFNILLNELDGRFN